jgi:hypothetical protein
MNFSAKKFFETSLEGDLALPNFFVAAKSGAER